MLIVALAVAGLGALVLGLFDDQHVVGALGLSTLLFLLVQHARTR